MLRKNEVRIYSYLSAALFLALIVMLTMADYYHADAKGSEAEGTSVYILDKKVEKDMLITIVVSETEVSKDILPEDTLDLIVRDRNLWNLVKRNSVYRVTYYKAFSGKYYLDEIFIEQ